MKMQEELGELKGRLNRVTHELIFGNMFKKLTVNQTKA